MKAFIQYDYYLQLLIITVGTVISFLELNRWGPMAFYFIVGIPQLISFVIKLFLVPKKSIVYTIYGLAIIPVWISVLAIYQLDPNQDIKMVFLYISMAALLYSPVMAIIYVIDCYKIYESYKNKEI